MPDKFQSDTVGTVEERRFQIVADVRKARYFAPLGGGFFCPDRISAVIHQQPRGPRITLDLAIWNGKPACETLCIHGAPSQGARLLTGDLKIPLASLLRQATAMFTVQANTDGTSTWVASGATERKENLRRFYEPRSTVFSPTDEIRAQRPELLKALEAIRKQQHPVPNRRGRVDDEKLTRVAAVYREADKAGTPPKQAVAACENVSIPTAGRYIMIARKRGFLGPAKGPGRKGEQAPQP
jgi:hypothetical protein